MALNENKSVEKFGDVILFEQFMLDKTKVCFNYIVFSVEIK
jgi:hypothetical protein